METPDGKVFSKDEAPKKGAPKLSAISGKAASVIGAGLLVAGRLAGRGIWFVLRAIGKFSITCWRLAAALDSALWRAIKLLAGRFALAAGHGVSLLGQVLYMFWLWLPTRTGRAYSAAIGVWLVILGLWMADELRAGSRAVADISDVNRPPQDDDDPILARIGGRFVHLSEIESLARASGVIDEGESLSRRAAFDRGLVETYVEQRLLAREAQDEGLHRTPQVLRQVNAARDRILAASLINDRVAAEVTPEAVQRFYNAQRDITVLGDEVHARHILVETGEEAQEIIDLLEGGADFAALARERSLDTGTARYGGDMGWFARGVMKAPIASAAFSTPAGEIAAPFQSEFGWHILKVEGRRPSSATPFSDVGDAIKDYLEKRLIDDTVRDLEAANQVIYYRPETDDSAVPAAPALPGEPVNSADTQEAEPESVDSATSEESPTENG